MFEKLRGLFGREQKQSAAGSVIAMNVVGKPVWTPRNYTALAQEGFAKNAIAYRCVRMIAEACAAVPLRVEFEGQRAPDHPLQKLIDRPNPEQGGADLREAIYGGLQTAGNAYVEAAFLDEETPGELWNLRPDRMKVVPGCSGWPEAYEYSTGSAKTVIGRDGEGWLKVLHLKLWHPLDDWYGLSPLEAAAFSIDVHNASGAWNKALLDNAARPSGALVYGSKASERLAEKTTRSLSAWLEARFPGTRIVNDIEALPALSAERDALWTRLEAASFLTDAERRHLAGLSEVSGEVER